MAEFSDVTQKTTLDTTELVLGATTATQTTPEKYSAEDIVSAGQRAGAKCFNVRDYFSGEPDKDTNYSSAFQQAQDDADAYGRAYVLIPPGAYGLLTTITIKVPTTGPTSTLQQAKGVWLHPMMTDGTAVLMAGTTQGLSLSNLIIWGGAGTDPATADNCIGLVWGTEAGTSQTRGIVENIQIHGCAIGFTTWGWINKWRNILVTSCQLGATLENFNDVVAELAFENCNKGFDLSQTSSCCFLSLSEEGVYGTAPSTINDVQSMVVCVYRTEGATRPASYLEIGKTSHCRNVRILSGTCGSNQADLPVFDLDDVEVYEIGCTFATQLVANSWYPVRKTAKTIGEVGITNHRSGFPSGENVLTASPILENVWPNPRHSSLSWPASAFVGGTRVDLSLETDTVFRGTAATRMTVVNGTASNYINIEMNDPDILAWAQGKTLTLACWIFIPDLPGFSNGNTSPTIALSTNVDPAINSEDQWQLAGQWNLFYVTRAISASITKLAVGYNPNISTENQTNEYWIVGETILVEGADIHSIRKGNYIDSPLLKSRYAGNAVEYFTTIAAAASIAALAKNTWKVGDKLTYTDPVSGGSVGEVCTGAGTGAAAVWKTYGAIA